MSFRLTGSVSVRIKKAGESAFRTYAIPAKEFGFEDGRGLDADGVFTGTFKAFCDGYTAVLRLRVSATTCLEWTLFFEDRDPEVVALAQVPEDWSARFGYIFENTVMEDDY